MSARTPDILPYVVPLEEAGDLEGREDPGVFADPAMLLASIDHSGVMRALDFLTPSQQEVLRAQVGLTKSGEPLSRLEICEQLGLPMNTVDSTLNRAKSRLRAIPGILDVINGEDMPGRQEPVIDNGRSIG